ncbi:MAG TPA: hypothetical protein VH879_14505 [Gemmatimonadales bacterium]
MERVKSDASPDDGRPDSGSPRPDPPGRPLLLVKVGGGLLALSAALPRVGEALARVAARRALVVVPGGGPFAEPVRAFQRDHYLSPSAAHWMAILAMDQYAHALVDHIPGGRLVEDRPGILAAHALGAVPVLAPFRWLRAADELPHTWEVTSDSLAAYLGTLLGAEELVLLKPVAGGDELVDPYFRRAVAAGMRWRVVSAAEESLDQAIGG